MARFEAALALAAARAGLVPAEHAQTIARVCERAEFDATALARAARTAGALAIPFVQQLTAQVATVSAEAARHVHFGATSQDVMDTAAALCVRSAGERLIALATRAGDAAAQLAERYARTPMTARTLLQPALLPAVLLARQVGGPRARIVVVTDHSSFNYDHVQRAGKVVVDTRNAIKAPGPHVVRLGAARSNAPEMASAAR